MTWQNGAMDVRPSRRLLVRLLAGTVVPTVGALVVFGFFAHQLARRALEDELSRRLETAAAGAAATILPEQLRAIGPGDEESLTYANVRRRVDVARAFAGTPAASPLFGGHDGVPYKRAYAAVGEPGEVGEPAGLVAVEGNADYPAVLAAFRRSMILAGIVAAIGVLALTAWIARRISGPITRLAQAAARLGRGDLDVPVPIETRDEIGLLAQTFDETRAALKARDERMQMVLSGIAHEVRNPLGGLELYAGLLRDALGEQPERLEEVHRIEREVGHLKTVVNEFLEFARRPPPNLEAVALGPLFDEVRELTRAASGAAIAVDVPPALRVRADAGQLRRVLLNLARNAATAARNGQVELAARPVEGGVRIEVRDDGPGVPAALREQIFTPFFTTREKGTGLGLAFVREIVRDHGGDVVVGDAPGGGSVFSFELPAVLS